MKFADKKDGFDFEQVLSFCRKNIRYISAAVIVVVLVIVLAVVAARPKKDAADQGEAEGAKTEEIQQEDQEADETPEVVEFQVDAIPEINTLMQNYFTAYAAGDTAALEGYATPFSELEKSFIGLTSKYISGYENIQCYSKPGLAEGEYAVSVVSDMRLEGVETVSPGLHFFYVRQREDGTYYIDNLYSEFNRENRVLELDSQVESFITEYEGQENFTGLWADVQARYDAALASDENLKNITENVLPQAVQDWVNELMAVAENTTPQQPDAAQPEEASDQQPEETQPEETPDQQPDAAQPEETPDQQPEETPSQDEGQAEGGSPQINYVPEGKVLTASQGYNVRASMSEDAERLGTTEIGDEIKVILSYAEGWTKVEWKDKTGYIRTDLLLNN